MMAKDLSITIKPRGVWRCPLLARLLCYSIRVQTITVKRPLGHCLLSGEAKIFIRKQYISQQMNLVILISRKKKNAPSAIEC